MSHKSYQTFWPVTGVVKTGKFTSETKLPYGNIGLVLQSTGAKEFIDPITLGSRKIAKNTLSLVRGLNPKMNTRLFEQTLPISKMEFLGITHPKAYTPGSATIGFNGIADGTSGNTISFTGGTHQTFSFKFWGESLTMLGMPGNVVDFHYTFAPQKSDAAVCEDTCEPVGCVPIVEEGILALLNYKLGNNDLTVGDFATTKPIYDEDCAPSLPGNTVTYYTLTKCDDGSDFALSEVQASVTNANAYGLVERVARSGAISTYKVATLSGGAPAANFTPKDSTFLKGCAACPGGFTELDGGYVYYVEFFDEGVDLGTTVEELANAVVGSATRVSSNGNNGIYYVLLSEQLSEADLALFLADYPFAIVGYEGYEKAGLCKSGAGTPINWASAGTCSIGTENYRIVLKDTDCQDSRLEELQAAYPDLTITELVDPAPTHCRRVYQAVVKTNVVCEDCDTFPIVTSERPSSYMGEEWYKVAGEAASTACKCGFEIKLKDIQWWPPVCLSDGIASIKPELYLSVAKAIPTDAGNIANEESLQEPKISIHKGTVGTQWGMDFMNAEMVANYKASGIYAENQVDKFMVGQTSLFETHKQYPVAHVKIYTSYVTSGASTNLDEFFVIQMPLIDTSEATLNYLETLNFN